MATIGVLLSGCGKMDGAEIHESVLALLAIDRAGHRYRCMAPNKPQHDVMDHLAGAEAQESRNILVESARIARGEVDDLSQVQGGQIDALVIPGGFGAAKNLSTFALDGPDCTVDAEVERLLEEVHGAGKPICAICIAPAIIARVFGPQAVRLTIGEDAGTAGALERMGATHVACTVDRCVVDERLKIVTVPAYMLGPTVSHVARGIDAAIEATLGLL